MTMAKDLWYILFWLPVWLFLLLLWIKNTFLIVVLMVEAESVSISFPFIILFLIFQFAIAVNGDLGVFYKEYGKKTLLIDWSFNDSLFLSTLAAQPITSKLDESWWAYKDVVQGSFVPGNRPLTHNILS